MKAILALISYKKWQIAPVLCAILALSNAASAATYVNLSFTLRAGKEDGVQFPKGYIVGGPHFKNYPYYSKLNVTAKAVMGFWNTTTVRFEFLKPVEIQILKDGKTETKEFSKLDMKLNLRDVRRFRAIDGYHQIDLIPRDGREPRDFFPGAHVSEHNTIEKVLEYSRTSPTMEPLSEYRNLPMLLVFDGDIRISRHKVEEKDDEKENSKNFTIAYSDFVNGEIDGMLSSCDLNEVIGFSDQGVNIVRGKTYHSEANVFDQDFLSLRDPNTREFIRIREQIEEIRMKKVIRLLPGSGEGGAFHYEVERPESNIVQLFPKCEDQVSAKKPSWKDLLRSLWNPKK